MKKMELVKMNNYPVPKTQTGNKKTSQPRKISARNTHVRKDHIHFKTETLKLNNPI